jgi:hypothetical protein
MLPQAEGFAGLGYGVVCAGKACMCTPVVPPLVAALSVAQCKDIFCLPSILNSTDE